MIKISVSESYAFDMLAIHEVKCKERRINKIKDSNYSNLKKEIAAQIGNDKLNQILKSKEYKKLLKDNQVVFDLVEVAKGDRGLARNTDIANYQRYISKIKLQNKFFKTETNEIKIGYEEK